MQSIPRKCTNVTVFPYITAPIEVPPVFINGAGTYSVGTLTTSAFYNLNLDEGSPVDGGVHPGLAYWASYMDSDGVAQRTPWMVCQVGGERPRFGRTVDMLHDGQPGTSDLVYQVHPSDVDVNLYHSPLEPIELPLIRGGHGVAKLAGLYPNAGWSVTVAGGERQNVLRDGFVVSIVGTNMATDRPLRISPTTTTDAGDPATFDR